MSEQSVKQSQPLMDIRGLSVEYLVGDRRLRAVDNVSFTINKGETVGLAGESGCGKSTLAFALTKLQKPPALIVEGEVIFDGKDVLAFDEEELRRFRWKETSVVFQSAMNCLNPVISINQQICDVLRVHNPAMNRGELQDRARELLRIVGIHPDRLNQYPHQFSGGMRQRAVLAISLALKPQLIIMDEPTTALDVVVEREIMDQLSELKEQFGFSILLISHDLSLMGEITDRIAVMYAGKLVEIAPTEDVLFRPQHPYTKGLVNSFPDLLGEKKELTGIAGNPMNLFNPPAGCYFEERCPESTEQCKKSDPTLITLNSQHKAKCHLLS
ncbi:ABC transporter ATP-binding protein [Leucothrix arctica]|uniref:Sugar ABC transporter ATP-binding protein n=1 Tax=Leucothrix arctica TaxID=1481894 RepID=A0A317CSP0_9GAMM|nr:ABC transporter ATP-binding protein [Leucothrix arctica]PWQ99342.1 sugar ABC transporter ATP-binding protein [Leucothrix arctica]